MNEQRKAIGIAVIICIVIGIFYIHSRNSATYKFVMVRPDKEEAKEIIQERLLNHKHDVDTQEDSLSLLRANGVSDIEALVTLDLSTLSDLQVILTLHNVLDNTQVICQRKLRFGNIGDGGWEVCDDRPTAPTPKRCLVYSFGISYDFSFDDKIAAVYECQVHSFDPSMKKDSHQRSPHVNFHNLGISNKSEVNTRGWRLDTLGGIRKQLGHLKTTIDVLKMDVEFAEWSSLPEMIQSGQLKSVKQLLVEFHTHPPSSAYYRRLNQGPYPGDAEEARRRLGIVQALLAAGFRAFYVHKNEHNPYPLKGFPGTTTICFEIHFINTNILQ